MIRILPFLLGMLLVTCAPSSAPVISPAKDQLFPLAGDVAGSQIVVAWKGASGSAPDLDRTREDALAKAQQLAEALVADPSLFDRLAREESDGPGAERNGNLGSWSDGALVPELNEAFTGLQIGQISAEPVASDFGWHLLRRDPLCVPHYGFEAFYIAFKGSEETPATVSRTRQEAEKMAQKVARDFSPTTFDKLARKYNDFAAGALPPEVFTPLDQAPPQLMNAFATLDFGAVMGPIELPVGFGFFRRIHLEKRAGAHILISFVEARSAKPEMMRTRAEADVLIAELLKKLEENPTRFQELAKQESDAPDAEKGGVLEPWYRGSMEPEFEGALDQLTEGQISRQAIETRYGYHIIRRDKIQNPCD